MDDQTRFKDGGSSWEPHRRPDGNIEISVHFEHANGRMTFGCVSLLQYLRLFDAGKLNFQVTPGKSRPEHNPTREEALAFLDSETARAEGYDTPSLPPVAEEAEREPELQKDPEEVVEEPDPPVVQRVTPVPVIVPVVSRHAFYGIRSIKTRMHPGEKIRILKGLADRLRQERRPVTISMLVKEATKKDGPLENVNTPGSLRVFLYTLKERQKTIIGIQT